METFTENEFFQTKQCSYRNCNKEIISTKRKDTKFCCRRCKDNESKYRRRQKEFINNTVKEEMKLVNFIKGLQAGQIKLK